MRWEVAALASAQESPRALVREEALLAVEARVAIRCDSAWRRGDLVVELVDDERWKAVGVTEGAILPVRVV